ncbi:hypothetical protein ISN45_Aa07g020020 [Arabidopsis thaliana x Arabidopsis arenosa]|uniref:Uncharacterized protein n=1 Tax=Arabidopsis thaliana x Arabidopsis arenosa TaxID=1240361 RepID=A0A8T1Y6T8_9BRAS|nr:hypothetical protein ISN45_Aa07g020020 [Arabidopsis thaliana x Arabidopsis arenosa]
MASSKAKKGLGDLFRHVMRHHKKRLDGSHETVSSSSVLEFGQGKSSASGSNPLRERNEDEGSSNNASEKSDFFHKEFLFSPRLKQESRYRKQTEKHSKIMNKMEEGFARKVGIENLFSVCAKMGKEVGVNEYNGMIKVCIHHARISDNVEAALDHIRKAIEYIKEINKCGSIIGKGTYVPLLKFLVDMGMVEEFQISKDVILESNSDALGQVGYYEMLLWIQVDDEEKIHELCRTIGDRENSLSVLQEYYIIALCEKDRKENLQRLLEIVDITKVSSPRLSTNIFGYLGRSLLESMAMKFLRELQMCGKDGVKTVSNLIFSYATSIPNSTVKDAVLKFNKLHEELDIMPSSTSYDKLITYLYDSNEVATDLNVADNMRKAGHSSSHSIGDQDS